MTWLVSKLQHTIQRVHLLLEPINSRWCFTFIYICIYIVSSFKSGAVHSSTWQYLGERGQWRWLLNWLWSHHGRAGALSAKITCSELIRDWWAKLTKNCKNPKKLKICCDVQRHLNFETDSKMPEKSYIQHFRKLLIKCFDCTSLASTVPCKPFAPVNGTGSLDLRTQESPGCCCLTPKQAICDLLFILVSSLMTSGGCLWNLPRCKVTKLTWHQVLQATGCHSRRKASEILIMTHIEYLNTQSWHHYITYFSRKNRENNCIKTPVPLHRWTRYTAGSGREQKKTR